MTLKGHIDRKVHTVVYTTVSVKQTEAGRLFVLEVATRVGFQWHFVVAQCMYANISICSIYFK